MIGFVSGVLLDQAIEGLSPEQALDVLENAQAAADLMKRCSVVARQALAFVAPEAEPAAAARLDQERGVFAKALIREVLGAALDGRRFAPQIPERFRGAVSL